MRLLLIPFLFSFCFGQHKNFANMVTKLHDIRQISSNSMQWNLKVREVRMWEIPDRYKPEIPYSIELVLPDAKVTYLSLLSLFSSSSLLLWFIDFPICNCLLVSSNPQKDETTHLKWLCGVVLFLFLFVNIWLIIAYLFHMDIFNLRPFDQFTNQHDVDEAELFGNFSFPFNSNTTFIKIMWLTFIFVDIVGQVVTYETVQTYKQGDNKSVFMNIELEDDK